ncbi:MAG: hypothetical protein AB2693_33295 [Candidatus Thiodiazotropha sp.]
MGLLRHWARSVESSLNQRRLNVMALNQRRFNTDSTPRAHWDPVMS